MAAKIFRINYKSDFILTLNSDAGWMTPFCIKFWTGAPSQAYFVGWDGTTYTHCAYDPSEPTKLVVQFDDHHLPIGDLKFQIAYHFTVADFPNDTEDEVINPANITTEIDGQTYQVMLDFTGETAPEIEFSLPAYANEAQRIANEQQRIANEEQRISAEQTRIDNEALRISAEQTRQDNEAQRIRNEQTRINQEDARVREFATLKQESEAATTSANNAAALANQKAQLAADKAQLAADKAALAQDAANLANQKAQLAADKAALANDAAALANEKAALAQQKAEYAKDQGDYAKQQGDYAKEQGDYAKRKGDDAAAQMQQQAQAFSEAQAARQTAYQQAEGTESGSVAGDGSRWGAFKTNEAARDAKVDAKVADITNLQEAVAEGAVYDISANNSGATYADLTAALGTNGANIPQSLRRGGMSVKFVQSSDNKYIQYRYMGTAVTGTPNPFLDIANWQGVDETPTTGSQNLVKSWGILSEIQSKEIDFTGVVPVDWFVTSGIPYYGTNGSASTNDSRRRTNYIKVSEGDAFAYTMNNSVTLLIIAAFNNGVLDLTHSVAGAGLEAAGTYTVPAGVTHIQFCNSNSHTPVITKTNPAHLDNAPTQNSDKLVKSGGVYSAIASSVAAAKTEINGNIADEDKYLKNLLRTEYVIINGGINNETGAENTVSIDKHTALFPVIDKGYIISGFNANNVGSVYYYSAPYIDSDHYVGYASIGAAVPTGAKFCSFSFVANDISLLDTLRIIPKKDIDNYLGETCVGIYDRFNFITDYTSLVKHLYFYKYGVKGMYLYGDSVDASQEYLVKVHSYVASTRTLRLIVSQYVSDEYTARIDKTIVVPEDKYLDTVLTQENYNLRIIADFNQVEDFSEAQSKYFKFNNRVFYPIVNVNKLKEDVEGLAEDISELSGDISALESEMNNPNNINVMTGDIEIVDYSEYYGTDKGAETGKYILLSSGQKKNNNNYTITPYISLDGITAIRTIVPSNSVGLGFYTGNDEAQYATQYIEGHGLSSGGDGVTWIPVPPTAKYFRTTVKNTDLSGETAVLDVKKAVTQTLQEFVDNQEKPTPRNTHVLYGYEGFCVGQKTGNIWLPAEKISSARNTLTQATLNEDVKQMVSENQLYFNKMRYEVTFEVKDTDTYIGIGYYPIAPYVYNELRVRNNNGSAVLEVYGGIGDPGDTYESEDFVVAESVVLPYSLTVGNVYTLGMIKFENETYNNTDHVDGTVYYIHSYADDTDANHPTEIFMPRNTGWSTGGIKNKTVASPKGYQFVSLKLGEVEITNMFVSSPYNPQAKAVILGDSYVDGDTVVSQGGQCVKYACLLQEKIGADSFVIAGKGGDAVTDLSKPYLNKETSLFYPKYLIPAFGANYNNLDVFTSQMTSFINWLVKIGIEPILVTTPPVGSKGALMVAQNAVIRSLGYRYVDVYKAVTDGNGNWIEGYVLADGVHPTAAGHQAIYEAFVREVPELFAV